MADERYRFVWVRGSRGPRPEKWFQQPLIGGEKEVLMTVDIKPEELELSLTELVARYPYQRSKEK